MWLARRTIPLQSRCWNNLRFLSLFEIFKYFLLLLANRCPTSWLLCSCMTWPWPETWGSSLPPWMMFPERSWLSCTRYRLGLPLLYYQITHFLGVSPSVVCMCVFIHVGSVYTPCPLWKRSGWRCSCCVEERGRCQPTKQGRVDFFGKFISINDSVICMHCRMGRPVC